jgi:phosphoenolpyruvate-protein kinase (PTS system EI component)
VLDRLASSAGPPRAAGEFILVRREVSPADLIELADAGLAGAVSVAGGASSHAAIIARGLGLPMLTGVDAAVLAVRAGQQAILDADTGELMVGTGPTELAAVTPNGARSRRSEPLADGPAATADGREITVLCNVASAAETRRGLAAGAAGVGLVRTEIPYTGALAWPGLADHRAQLAPILGLLAERTATVRLLDFSGDKIPPFLQAGRSNGLFGTGPAAYGTSAPGLAALLAHRTALPDQLRAVLEAGRDTQLGVLIPMVSSLNEVGRVRAVLGETAAALGAAMPRLGIMVELAATAAAAERFAPEVGFFSIGTNDLTGQVLGLGREDPAAKPSLAAHPEVLRLVAHVADAGRRAGIPVSVCGDAAADPLVLPLLVGLGIDVLSVPAARVRLVRSQVAALDSTVCTALAREARSASSAEEVWKLVLAL